MVKRFFITIFLLTALFASGCAQKLIIKNVTDQVTAETTAGTYQFRSGAYQFNTSAFTGWLIEETAFRDPEFKGVELFYRTNYKDRKERLLDMEPKEESTDQTMTLDKYDLRTYWMVYSYAAWLDFVRNLYGPPIASQNALAFMDEYGYRLINPERTRIYDVMFLVSKREDFAFSKGASSPRRERKLLADIQAVNPLMYRNASVIRSIDDDARKINGFSLVQSLIERTLGGPDPAAAGRRVRDTYVVILTGEKVKVIIQGFYRPDTKEEDVEKDVRAILGAITIKERS